MPTARIYIPPASDYTDTVNVGNQAVPALTAGSIDNVSPETGDTLTVTGSNAPAGEATYLWQVDTGTGFGAAGGTNDAATYDTTGQPTGNYRRGVELPKQAMVYTAAVTVSAVAAAVPRLLGQAQIAPTASIGPHTISVPTTGHVSGETVYAFITARTDSVTVTIAGSTVTLNAEAMSEVGAAHNGAVSFRNSLLCSKRLPTGALPSTTDVVVTFPSGGDRNRIHVALYAIPGTIASEAFDGGLINNADGTVDVSQNTVTGDHCIVHAVSRGILGTFTLAGVTAGSIVEVPDGGQLVLSGLATSVTGETPRTMSATKTSPDSSKDLVVGSLVIRPA